MGAGVTACRQKNGSHPTRLVGTSMLGVAKFSMRITGKEHRHPLSRVQMNEQHDTKAISVPLMDRPCALPTRHGNDFECAHAASSHFPGVRGRGSLVPQKCNVVFLNRHKSTRTPTSQSRMARNTEHADSKTQTKKNEIQLIGFFLRFFSDILLPFAASCDTRLATYMCTYDTCDTSA